MSVLKRYNNPVYDEIKVYSDKALPFEYQLDSYDTLEAEAGRALDQQARQYAYYHNCSYELALTRVMSNPTNQKLLAEYCGVDYRPKPVKLAAAKQDQQKSIGAEIGRILAKFERENPDHCLTYEEMMNTVLDAHPDIKQRYAEEY